MQGKVYLIGDSLTQFSWTSNGLAAVLADRYQRRLDVINRGFSGYNSTIVTGFVERLAREGDLDGVKLVTIWLGANDSVLPGEARAVDPQTYSSNLVRLVSLLPADARVLLLTPPPFCAAARAEHERANPDVVAAKDREEGHTRLYSSACLRAADEVRGSRGTVAAVELCYLMEDEAVRRYGDRDEGLKKFLHDGVHLTQEGYKIVSNAVVQAIERHFPDLDAASMRFPDWK
ncbi:uncharacterized protein PSFLO_05009 [Pseudozyma flocculosa]|nr:uncharacterized protein PSFLO_05009 [Pseudozyma flocculosa]